MDILDDEKNNSRTSNGSSRFEMQDERLERMDKPGVEWPGTKYLWKRLRARWEEKKKLRVVQPMESEISIEYQFQVYEWTESEGMLGFVKDHVLVFLHILLYGGILAGIAIATVKLRRWQIYGGGICDLRDATEENLQQEVNNCSSFAGKILWKGWRLPSFVLHVCISYLLYILFPMGLYNPFVGYILYGKKFFVKGDKARLFGASIMSIALAVSIRTGPAILSSLIIVGSWLYVNVMMGIRLVRKSKRASLKNLWVFSQILQAGSSALLLQFFPLAITRYVGVRSLSVLRFIVFPVCVEITLVTFRIVARQCSGSKPGLQGTLLLLPIVWRAIYGRFLLVQFEAVGSITAVNLLLVIYGVISTMSARDGDDWIYTIQYGQRLADALLSTKESMETATWMRFVSIICEIVAIPATAALYTFAKVADASGNLTKATTVWYSYSLQLIAVLAGFFASMMFDSIYNGLHMARGWRTRGKKLLTWLAILILVIFVPLNYIYLMSVFFCPSKSEEHGIILESCDKPALF